jgi:hypothetical protein
MLWTLLLITNFCFMFLNIFLNGVAVKRNDPFLGYMSLIGFACCYTVVFVYLKELLH